MKRISENIEKERITQYENISNPLIQRTTTVTEGDHVPSTLQLAEDKRKNSKFKLQSRLRKSVPSLK